MASEPSVDELEEYRDLLAGLVRIGRQRTEPVDWLTAEETLDGLGLTYLADPYELRLDSGSWLRVRITEVSTDGVRVKKDDWGDVNAPELYYSVPFPADENLLRPLGERA